MKQLNALLFSQPTMDLTTQQFCQVFVALRCVVNVFVVVALWIVFTVNRCANLVSRTDGSCADES